MKSGENAQTTWMMSENWFGDERAWLWCSCGSGGGDIPGRLPHPATPTSSMTVGSNRPSSSLLPLCIILSAYIEFSVFLLASSSFSFTFDFFFFLLVFDVRIFLVFHCMVHIPFIYLLELSRGKALNFGWCLFFIRLALKLARVREAWHHYH